MAAILSAVFRGVDEMSNILDSMASSGEDFVAQWERAGSTANQAFGTASAGAAEVARSVSDAASATDFWTDALGNYDKGALEAVYSTEELVEMGFKSREALEAEASAAEMVAQKFEEQAKSAEDAAKEQDKMGETGVDAISKIEQALVTAGITVILKEAVEAVLQLANEFSEAESVIVKATGATGEALESLDGSMMKVYSNIDDGDLNNTAATIGELNTRLHLQGEELERVGTLFMTYADNTNSDAVGAVQNVTKVMKNWNVEVENTEQLLDKLTYAGQASGISVDQLSNMLYSNKAVLDQLGFSLDESIALFSMFEDQGLDASSTMMGFRTAVAQFSDDGLDASTAMQEVIDQISAMSDESAATSLAVETFGTRAGPRLADAIRSGKFEIDEWTAAIENSNGTLAKTDEAADTVADKWTQATNSMETAFSGILSPTINDVSAGFAGLVEDIGNFLNEHPVVTKAITAVGIGLGVVVVGIAGVTFVTTVAIPAVTAFGVALNTALGPIGWVALAITGVTAAGAALIAMCTNAEDATAGMTASTRDQYYELQDLNAEYEQACDQYGETSDEALRLKYQVDDLSTSFEANRQTLEEFVAECDELVKSSDKVISSYQDGTKEIRDHEVGTLALITKLEDLASQNEKTAGTEEQMRAIVGKLNEELPDLSLTYENVTGNVDGFTEAMKKAAAEQAKQNTQEKQMAAFTDALERQTLLTEEIAKAEANLGAEREARGMEYNEAMQQWSNGWYTEDSPWAGWTTDLDDYNDKLEELNAQQAENNALISEIEGEWDAVAEAASVAAEQPIAYEDAVNQAVQSVSDGMNELIAKYDEAYAAARESIDGQIGLFDTMKTETELSISDMQTAMQTQIDYLAIYTENLQKAAEYGLDEGLIASLSDGSEESAGYINAIIENIEKLGGTTEGLSGDAAAFVENFNSQFEQVETAKDNFATTVAKMETDFDAKMSEIEGRMNAAIDNMNMSDDAAAAAHDTISAYVSSISSMTDQAYTAAASVAAAAQNGLKSKGISLVGLPGFASGTLDAPDMFIAGEEGPELIVGAGGSTVFPVDETEKILSATGRAPLDVAAPDDMELNGDGDKTTTIEKKITLEIAGSGAIDVSGPYDEERMTGLLFANLKPALMGLLKKEMFEEGDLAYEF